MGIINHIPKQRRRRCATRSRKLGCLLVVVACVNASLCRIALAQTKEPAASDYRSAIADRIDAIATLLEGQAQKSSSLRAEIESAKPESVSTVLQNAERAEVLIAPSVKTALRKYDSRTMSNTTTQIINKQIAVDTVAASEDSVAAYARHLKQLSSEVRTSNPEQVSTILASAYVPPSVAVVLNPNIVNVPVTPSTSLSNYVLGGSSTVDYPAIGAVLYVDPSGGLSIGCTATLIAPNAVLTAAHCVASLSPRGVYFQHAGDFLIDKEIVNARYAPSTGDTPALNDVAILILKSPVEGISPLGINSISTISPGSTGVIVGFGWRSNPIVQASAGSGPTLIPTTGIKVWAVTTTDACSGDHAGKNLICWTYPKNTVVQTLGSTCFGDSGGPFAIEVQGAWRLAGVTSGGSGGSKACHPGDNAYDVEVYAYAQWIQQELKQNPAPAGQSGRDTLGPLLNDEQRYFLIDASDRTFDPSGTKWTPTLSISAGVSQVRIGVNATPTGNELTLQAVSSSGATGCHATSQDSVVFCDLPQNSTGSWQLTVSGSSGQEYQVVATAFP